MPLPKDQAWFPAKTRGWGWGPPRRWQGWIVMIGFAAALFLGLVLLASQPVLVRVAYIFAVCVITTAICYAKGEAPRWRWGDDETP